MYNVTLEAEQMFLGSMIKSPDLIGDFVASVEPNDFSHGEHRLIWATIKHLFDNGKPVSTITIEDAIKMHGREREIEDFDYLTRLPESVVSLYQAGYYGELVRKNSAYRKTQQLADELRQMAQERTQEKAEDVFQAIDAKLIKLQTSKPSNLVPTNARAGKYADHLKVKAGRIPTGHAAFDEWSGGAGRGWLYVLAGRPSVGKTAKAVQKARSMSEQNAGAVLFWSMEMTTELLLDRALCNLTGINYKKFVRKEMSEAEQQRVLMEYDYLAQFPLLIDDSPLPSFSDIRAGATSYRRKHGPIAAIVVDYLTHMDIKVEKGQTFSKAVEDTCKRFKALARELDCVVILLCQLNRDAENEGKRPTMANLKDSGGIEQAADLVEILWRDSTDAQAEAGKDYALITSSIVKGRFTGTRDFKYKFYGHLQRYEDHPIDPVSAVQNQYVPNADGLIHWGAKDKPYRRR